MNIKEGTYTVKTAIPFWQKILGFVLNADIA